MRPYIIGITGGTASGKTFVIEALKDRFNGKILVISQDQYYKSERGLFMNRWERANFDSPEAFDNHLLVEHLQKLIEGETVLAPVYDYKTHHRLKTKIPLEPRPVIIVEGIMIFNIPQLREMFDYKIYLQADPDIRLARRLLRDIEERGVSIANLRGTIEWYMNNVKPMHEKYIRPMKKYADLILNTNHGGLGAAEKVAQIIEDKLKSAKGAVGRA
jgi:uridine kinase